MWRLGEHLAARFPVRAAAAPLVEHEQQWLPTLAARLPVDLPVPLRTGLPSVTYPWTWSIVPWFDGVAAHRTPVASRTSWAGALADVFVALHVAAPAHAPVNPHRGVPIAAHGRPTREEPLRERLEKLALPDGDRILERWRELAAAPTWDGPALWLHGDPHPANLLVHGGRLRAVIDFGDITSGDPASDLSTAWLTFDADGRGAFRARLAYDDATWRRAQAWALHMAVVLQMHPVDHPHLAEIGRHGITQALAD